MNPAPSSGRFLHLLLGGTLFFSAGAAAQSATYPAAKRADT